MLIEKQRENLKNKNQELQKSIHITRHETGSTEYRPLWPYEEEKKNPYTSKISGHQPKKQGKQKI